LREAEERLLFETKALHTHRQGEKKEETMSEKTDVHESKKKIRAHRASSKVTRLFLICRRRHRGLSFIFLYFCGCEGGGWVYSCIRAYTHTDYLST